MKSFSNSTIYPVLPYDVWEMSDSPDFSILPLLPSAILEKICRLSDSSYFTDSRCNHINRTDSSYFTDSPI